MRWRTVLVSNQPVLARGESLRRSCAASSPAGNGNRPRPLYFDRIYVAHITPIMVPGSACQSSRFSAIAASRNPASSLCAKDLNIDLARSWYIGDATADLGAAEKAGVSSILVETGHGGLDLATLMKPDSPSRTFQRRRPSFFMSIKDPAGAPRASTGRNGQATIGSSEACRAPANRPSQRRLNELHLRLQGRRARIVHTDRWLRDDNHRPAFAPFDMGPLKAAVATAERPKGRSVTLMLPAIRGGHQLESNSCRTKS